MVVALFFWSFEMDKKRKIEVLEQKIDMLQQTILRLSKIHKPKYKHFCHEWDGLEIDEFCPEFSCCSCFEVSK